VEFANKQRHLGADLHKAITTAAAIRFRPILMTFLATFLDLIPMAIGLGRGSEANVPLARAVVGGLLTSTCLTLFVVPILYTLLLRKGDARGRDVEDELADEPVPAPALAPTVAAALMGGPAAQPSAGGEYPAGAEAAGWEEYPGFYTPAPRPLGPPARPADPPGGGAEPPPDG
jgi:hypothetical protein